jgi:hypothetical protein
MKKQLRLAGLALTGVLYLWYAGVLKAGGVKARKAAWREARARGR